VEATLARELRAIYGAYEYLREHDLTAVSSTSRLLHERDLDALGRRAHDEMAELRGVIAGSHGHGGGRDHVVLEAYQVMYWLTILAVAAGDGFDDVRPDEALAIPPSSGAATEQSWAGNMDDWYDPPHRRAALRAGLAAVAALCATAGVAIDLPVQRDAAELRSKPYLSSYWAHAGEDPDQVG